MMNHGMTTIMITGCLSNVEVGVLVNLFRRLQEMNPERPLGFQVDTQLEPTSLNTDILRSYGFRSFTMPLQQLTHLGSN